MDLLQVVAVFLGAAMVVCLLYLALTNQPIPPPFRAVVLIAVALLIFFCLAHAAGCRVPRVVT